MPRVSLTRAPGRGRDLDDPDRRRARARGALQDPEQRVDPGPEARSLVAAAQSGELVVEDDAKGLEKALRCAKTASFL
jgi:hypothetical protein